MKLLVIGTDKSIFEKDSAARGRVEAYGRLFDELHIVIYTAPGFMVERPSPRLFIYPTNSRFLFLRPFQAVRVGKQVVRSRQIDLISAQDPSESGLAGWLLKKMTGLPLHVQIHADIFSPFFRRNSWKELLRYWQAKFVIPRGDAFRVVSRRIKDSLNSKFKTQNSKLTILPIFVDRERISSAVPKFNLHDKHSQFDFIILMVSRLVREKNTGLALETFRELLSAFPKTGLVIVGDGPERENLEFRIQSLGLSENVRFEGWQNDLVSYYKTSDLYLLTSNFEGYGRSVVEAAAAGLPIVMTDVGVAGEIIRDGETGRIVPVGNKHALVQALIEARQNYARMKDMAFFAEKLVRETRPRTFEEYLDKYCQSYENILSN